MALRPRAAGVSPPWLRRRNCKNASAKSLETADGVLANAGADAVAKPRGAYAPRSWLYTRSCIAKVALSPTNLRAFNTGAAGVSPPWCGRRNCNTDTAHVRRHSSRAKPGAAGVSPPWCGRRNCKNASAKSLETADGVLANAVACALLTIHGGLTPPRSRAHAFVHRKSRIPLRVRCPIGTGTDAPRSRFGEDAFVQRKSRFFTAERTPYTRAAGVSPPCVALTHLQWRFRRC